MNSLYESYWPFIYIISHLLFQKYMWKPTLYWHCKHCSFSCKGLWAIIVCFVSFIKLMQFCSYIYSINLFYFINRLIEHNLYWFFSVTAKKVSLFFLWGNICFCYLNDIIISKHMKPLYDSYWPFIYIIFHFLFQPYYLKPTLHWHCNRRCSSKNWQWSIIVYFVCCINTLIWLKCYIF